MYDAILFGDTSENFYLKLGGFIKQAIIQELTTAKNPEEDYIKKPTVASMLKVSNPTIDSHVKKGYYKKYQIGSRVVFSKIEILNYIKAGGRSTKI